MVRNFVSRGGLCRVALMVATVFTMAAAPMPGEPFLAARATGPLASEPGDNPGAFTISRLGGETNAALSVSFTLSGTATNGVDYAAVPTSITLAAGQISSNIVITPVAEPLAVGYKKVILTLADQEARGQEWRPDYGFDGAVVYIVYNYTDVAPTVKMVAPTNGSSFLSLPNIELAANASDSNGWVSTVEFFANGNSVGTVTNDAFLDGPAQPLVLRDRHGSVVSIWPGARTSRFQFVWTNVPPGAYEVDAVATANAGLQTTSAPVQLTVTTNLPSPKVRIVNPVNDAKYAESASINIYAAAGEAGGVIDAVAFLANGNTLGMATNYLAAEPTGQFHLRLQWLPYYFRWTNAPVGSNILTAIAIDNNGTLVTSAPVNINVTTNLHRRHW
jgi:hypothetical protein